MSLSRIEARCLEHGVRMTEQRRIIARILSEAEDHPDVEQVYQRAVALDDRIGIATVYRTLRLFEEAGVLEKHDFRDGRARYETVSDIPHDHLIDLKTGAVIEFQSDEVKKLLRQISDGLGHHLVDYRLELYGTPLLSKDVKEHE
jgi:Fur family ferric uptake transcriptional regulator